jgi:hypothetical protein
MFHILASIGATLALAAFFMPWLTTHGKNGYPGWCKIGSSHQINFDNQTGYQLMTDQGVAEYRLDDAYDITYCAVQEREELLWIVFLGLVLVLVGGAIYWKTITTIGQIGSFLRQLYLLYLIAGVLGIFILGRFNDSAINRFEIPIEGMRIYDDMSFEFGFWLAVIGQTLVIAAGVCLWIVDFIGNSEKANGRP